MNLSYRKSHLTYFAIQDPECTVIIMALKFSIAKQCLTALFKIITRKVEAFESFAHFSRYRSAHHPAFAAIWACVLALLGLLLKTLQAVCHLALFAACGLVDYVLACATPDVELVFLALKLCLSEPLPKLAALLPQRELWRQLTTCWELLFWLKHLL